MRNLYLLLLFSLAALLWAAFSIATHIRRHRGHTGTGSDEALPETVTARPGEDAALLTAMDTNQATPLKEPK